MLKRIDHVSLAVKNVDEFIDVFQRIFNAKVGYRDTSEKYKNKVAFLEIGDGLVELQQGLDPTTGIAKFVSENGEGLHHICFEVENIRDALSALEKQGIEIIDKVPKPAAYEKEIAFAAEINGILIQLCAKA
jgi:methylmalonyl-CoA/ethylmalonyl-CoA epimerase